MDRRQFIPFAIAAPAMAITGALSAAAQDKKTVAALFSGKTDDGGFMQAGYEGLMRAAKATGATPHFLAEIPPQPEKLADALRMLAHSNPDLIIAHGGQNNAAAKAVAAEFPGIAFAVTQGNVTSANLGSYEVLQEHSAFLGGMLAALMTKTGVVGHMSGFANLTPCA